MTEAKNLSLNDFRYHLCATWSLGVARVGQRLVAKWKREWSDLDARLAASNRFAKERVRLQRICREMREDAADPLGVDFPVYENGNLWIGARVRERLLGLAETPARVFFEENKKFVGHLNEGFSAVLKGELTAIENVFDTDKEMLGALEQSDSSHRLVLLVPFIVTAGVELTLIRVAESAEFKRPFEKATGDGARAPSGQKKIAGPSIDVQELRADLAREYDTLVLQAVVSVEHFGLTPAPDYLVRLITNSFATSIPPTEEARSYRFGEAIYRLQREGRIEQDRVTPDCWHANQANIAIGILPLVSWVIDNRQAILRAHWRTLLGEEAVRATSDPKALLSIVDVGAALLAPDDGLLKVYADALERLAGVSGNEYRERLLQRCGELRPSRAKHLAGLLHEENRMDEFLTLASGLDDNQLAQLVPRISFDLRRMFERLARHAIFSKAHLPIIKRIAAALDDVQFARLNERRFAAELERWCDETEGD